MATKKTLGRRRIEIKKLEKKSTKQVTFSKRRAGLFKKASELSVLCGAEVAIIIFSPNEKLFCFGHPNVDVVLDRFISGSSSPPKLTETDIQVAELNRSHAEALNELEKEKKIVAQVVEAVRNRRSDDYFWWDEPIENMKLEDLKEYRAALLKLRRKVVERIEGMVAMNMGGSLMPALSPSSFHISAGDSEKESAYSWW